MKCSSQSSGRRLRVFRSSAPCGVIRKVLSETMIFHITWKCGGQSAAEQVSMKKYIGIFALLALVAAPAMADIYIGAVGVQRVVGYYGGNGGEFTLSSPSLFASSYVADVTKNIPGSWGPSAIQTFCVETSETIDVPSTVYGRISTTFSDGMTVGSHSANSNVNLSDKTAFLYTQFAAGTLAGFDYGAGSGRVADAVALQKAIWYYQSQVPAGEVVGNEFVALAEAATGWTGIGQVRILNVYSDPNYTQAAQDQLVMVVPASAAFVLGAFGLGLVGWVKRRMA